MDSLSHEILAVLLPFSVLFSQLSWQKAQTLILGTLLCMGKRTVCSALRAIGLSGEVGFSKYHHLLNRTKWSSLRASRILFFMLLALIPEGSPIVLFIDETLERRRGKKIKAKGYYRDAVRSSKSQTVKASGLKWLVMAISVKLPMVPRTLALPFLTTLEFSKKYDEKRKRRHKTTLRWTRQMLCQVLKWIDKKRKLILVGDGGFATSELAWDCIRYGVALVSRLKMNARLFDFPSERTPGKRGRIPLKGKRLINFKEMLALEGLSWNEVEIKGYGGIKRLVRFISTTSMWGAEGAIPVPIRWVLVVDPTGKLDPLPLMSTDVLMTPEQIIGLYIDRWNIEVTFEESREHLGVETQRQWSDKAIARSTPILLGLYSLVCLMATRLGQTGVLKVEETAWYHKEHVTFSDMLRAVRMAIWYDDLILQKAKIACSVENITPEMEAWAEMVVKRLLQAA
jgi:DDE superfamily endonuclease